MSALTPIDTEPAHQRLVGTTTAERLAGCTRRQLDHWSRCFTAPAQPALGSGSRRGFSLRDVLTLRALYRASVLAVGNNRPGTRQRVGLRHIARVIDEAQLPELAAEIQFTAEHVTVAIDLAINTDHEPELAEWVAAELPGADQ